LIPRKDVVWDMYIYIYIHIIIYIIRETSNYAFGWHGNYILIEQVRQFGSVEGSKGQNIVKLDEEEWNSECGRYVPIIRFTHSIIPSASEFEEWF
jgi:hypothetical protein